MIDLHVHSTASDGTCTPTELIEMAKAQGLSAIALTDHETTTGLEELEQAGALHGVETVRGIELASSWYAGELHLLGYFIDPTNSALSDYLALVLENRNMRNMLMLDRLNSLGVKLTLSEVQQEREGEGDVLSRPHFARAMVRKGICARPQEAFHDYLGNNRAAYVRRYLPLPEDAIAVIHGAGGIAVWAHPTGLQPKSMSALRKVARHLQRLGIDGIECYYPYYTQEQHENIVQLTNELGLLISGGSDFHGGLDPDVKLGIGRGKLEVPDSVLEELKQGSRGR